MRERATNILKLCWNGFILIGGSMLIQACAPDGMVLAIGPAAIIGIGALAGAAGGVLNSVTGRKAARTQRSLFRRARRMLSPSRISAIARQLHPEARAMIAKSLGSLPLQAVESASGGSAITGGGVDAALKGLASSVPDVEAFKLAYDRAFAIQSAKAQLTAGQPVTATPSGTLGALTGGARGAIGAMSLTGAGTKAPSMTALPALESAPSSSAERFPNLHPSGDIFLPTP